MKLHERTILVQTARREIKGAVWDLAMKHELTILETLQCVSAAVDEFLMYAIREERHPGDPEKKGDEA